MNVILEGGPLHGKREFGIVENGGGRLERSVPELRTDELYVLARYVRTDVEIDGLIPKQTREGWKHQRGKSRVYRFSEMRYVPRSDPRTRREPAPGEQLGLAV